MLNAYRFKIIDNSNKARVNVIYYGTDKEKLINVFRELYVIRDSEKLEVTETTNELVTIIEKLKTDIRNEDKYMKYCEDCYLDVFSDESKKQYEQMLIAQCKYHLNNILLGNLIPYRI